MHVPLEKLRKDLERHYRKKWAAEKGRPLHEWWPVSGKFKPVQLEIVAGTILTQNTNWRNVEKALQNLVKEGLTNADSLASCSTKKLQAVIRPAGFFTQKAERLKTLAKFILGFDGDFYRDVTREQLLAIKGIGPETADSILLYACGRPEFVVDAYSVRILSRYGLLDKNTKYDDVKRFVESRTRKNTRFYKEFHALLVEHAKAACRKKPLCGVCTLRDCKRIMEQPA